LTVHPIFASSDSEETNKNNVGHSDDRDNKDVSDSSNDEDNLNDENKLDE